MREDIMFSRMKMGLKRASNMQSESTGSDMINVPLVQPRLWMILLVLALPFFIICEDYFEALESTGTLGAFIADVSLPACVIGYVVLVVILRKRKL